MTETLTAARAEDVRPEPPRAEASVLTPPEVDVADLPRDLAGLRAHFAPLFAQIAEGSRERDHERILPFEEVRALHAAGFAVLRVPAEAGGPGVDVRTAIALLVDLAEADSNVAHLYRSHLGFLDALRFQPEDVRTRWYGRVLAGATVGNASTEKGGNALGTLNTVLTEDAAEAGDDGAADSAPAWTLSGTKYYATGSIFSSHTRVSASVRRADGSVDAGRGFAVVPVDAAGVTLEDDWDGFGQRLTGTGTAVFEDVRIPAGDVLRRIPGTPEAVFEAAYFQLILLAVLAGIARASRRDAAARVAARVRTFNTGLGLPFREDPLIQEAVGRIAAKAFTAEAAVLAAAEALDAALAAGAATGADRWGYDGETPLAFANAEVAVEHAQITVPELAIGAAQELFLTGGASDTSTAKGLDRHWRNAQTVATHNPIAFRARAVGDYWINGTLPEGLSAIGDAPATGSGPTDAAASAVVITEGDAR
ncbi:MULTISPECIES: acyl-CoA dehydrogenase family protein [Micrococcus]|uniref:acyl-CoA dehydrogenase family protein n=1 Tax=Micrococcus TaxID=1269 RepID=UPI0029B8ED15|nr:acyl-CoA dehydrogenase family protein [Micrococcus sp. M4NT]MDX2341375.1 acyl-CoA dehydrogenase family protein [Micrococcus sp. M4NT]